MKRAVVALAGLALALVACNLIVGIEDVRLRSDIDDDGGEPGPDATRDGQVTSGGVDRPNIFQAALGEQHTCARKPDGTVKCWGDDTLGQTGTDRATDGGFAPTPLDVPEATDAIDIAAGRVHTCIVRKSGVVSCWGYNLDGQLGNGENGSTKAVPTDVADSSLKASLVAGGGNFSCAVKASDGSVACWGGNGSGQLGRGDQAPTNRPVAVKNLRGVVGISAALSHVCAVTSDGAVYCWGEGSNGQLSGTRTGSTVPRKVDGLPECAAVATTERSSCALTKTGTVLCWGANENGQLGTGTTNATPSPAPAPVVALDRVKGIRGGRTHVCALREGGTLACWGASVQGQLGDGKTHDAGPQPTPVAVATIQNAVNVGAGGDQSCATQSTGMSCWGSNSRGQLGTAGGANELAPVPVRGY